MKYHNGKDLMEFFPLDTPRSSQVALLKEIDAAFESGKEFIIIEAPVGSGKSAIAMTLAGAFNEAHLITPRRSLQNQYFDDFPDDVVLMKGRSSYPCTYKDPGRHSTIIRQVETGNVPYPAVGDPNCGTAPCRNSQTIANRCKTEIGTCPYSRAMEIAEGFNAVVHNLHSFLYQTSFSMKFNKRKILIVDEAHEMESTLREFITAKIALPSAISPKDLPTNMNGLDGWCDFFLKDICLPKVSTREENRKKADPDFKSLRDQHIERVELLRESSAYLEDHFTVKHDVREGGVNAPVFEFIPHKLGNAASKYVFSYGEKIVLMSGTIYDKATFCKNLGIPQEKAHYLRIPSSFPLGNRPIYLRSDYQAETSYQGWNDNFKDIIEKIEKIMNVFPDVKGLIHAPSYEAAEQLAHALPDDRVVTHGKSDFQQKLSDFYASNGNQVFISPVCQQGVDFKGDRARFQVILRVPFLNTSDLFIRDKVERDFAWYNYQALVVFGQQIGRVNRSEDDYGATFLLDNRFNRFISKNSRVLPKWLQQAIIWR